MPESTSLLGGGLNTPNPSNPVPDAEGEGAANQQGPSRSQRRFDELTKQKYDLMRSVEAKEVENRSLATRLEALEARLEQAPIAARKSVLNREWKELGEDELLGLVQGDGVNPVDPATILRVSKEIGRREVEAKLAEARKEFQAENAKKTQIDRTWGQVISQFGPDVQKMDSPLRSKAESLANALVQEEGSDVFQRNPRLLYFIFAEADRQLRIAKASDDNKELERLRAVEKSRLTGEDAMSAAVESTASMKDLIAKGDIRGALMQTDMIRGMRGLPPKSTDEA